LNLKPGETLPIQVKLKRDVEAVPVPWQKDKMKLPYGTQVIVRQMIRRYTIEKSLGKTWIEKNNNRVGPATKPKAFRPISYACPSEQRSRVRLLCSSTTPGRGVAG
jgi:hypothetical protein